MNNPSATQEHAPTRRLNVPDPAGDPPELPVTVPSDFPIPHPMTGTVDDDDAPADEHESENEAMVRETNDSTETPEEFEQDDEDPEDTAV
jgi:hypothetical protein